MKRILPVFILLLSLFMSIFTSCSSKNVSSDVIKSAENFLDAVVSLKVSDIKKNTEVRKETTNIINTYILGDGLDNEAKGLYKSVLETLSYDMDKNSLSVSSNNDDAMIDVTFSMVDYNKILADNKDISSISEFVDLVSSTKDKIEFNTKLRLYFDGDLWVVDNVKDIFPEVFGEAYNLDSSFILRLSERVTDIRWDDITYNTNDLTCYVTIDKDPYLDEPIYYYYEFYYNNEFILKSDVMNEVVGGCLIASEYAFFHDDETTDQGTVFVDPTAQIYIDGTYTYRFFTSENEYICEDSREVKSSLENYNPTSGLGFKAEWSNPEDGIDTYLNVGSIVLYLYFDEYHQSLLIDSYYTVAYEGEVIYTSDTSSKATTDGYLFYAYGVFFGECPVVEDNPDKMYPGEYTITVYDSLSDMVIVSSTCNVLYGDDIVLENWNMCNGFSYTNTEDSWTVCFTNDIGTPIYDLQNVPLLYYTSNLISIDVVSKNSYYAVGSYSYEYYLSGEFLYKNTCYPGGTLSDTCHAKYEGIVVPGEYEVLVYNPYDELVTKIAFTIE